MSREIPLAFALEGARAAMYLRDGHRLLGEGEVQRALQEMERALQEKDRLQRLELAEKDRLRREELARLEQVHAEELARLRRRIEELERGE